MDVWKYTRVLKYASDKTGIDFSNDRLTQTANESHRYSKLSDHHRGMSIYFKLPFSRVLILYIFEPLLFLVWNTRSLTWNFQFFIYFFFFFVFKYDDPYRISITIRLLLTRLHKFRLITYTWLLCSTKRFYFYYFARFEINQLGVKLYIYIYWCTAWIRIRKQCLKYWIKALCAQRLYETIMNVIHDDFSIFLHRNNKIDRAHIQKKTALTVT